MKLSALLILGILFLGFFTVLPISSTVHATTPLTVVKHLEAGATSFGTVLNVAMGTVTQGDLLMLAFTANSGKGAASVVDSLGTQYVNGNCSNSTKGGGIACMFWGILPSTGTDTITFTLLHSSYYSFAALEINAQPGYALTFCTGTGAGTVGNLAFLTSSSSCAAASDDIVVVSAMGGAGSGLNGNGAACNPGAGFGNDISSSTANVLIDENNNQQCAGNPFTAQNFIEACGGGLVLPTVNQATCSGIAKPTSFPAGVSGCNSSQFIQCYWSLYGVVVSAILTTVIPCTWFQQQCWWYPSLFFGLYLGLFAVVARKAEIEKGALTYLMLSGLNMAAIAQTAMGLLTPVLPLLLITLTVVYVVRFRNR